MVNYSKAFKRVWAGVLLCAMLFSAVSLLAVNAFAAEAEPDERETFEKTDGEIIAGNYESLTEAEKKIIASGYLVGDTHSFSAPNDKDNLISVDINTKKVTAKGFELESGYAWVPVSAVLSANGMEDESITFAKDGEVYVAPYTCESEAFAVKVKYEVRVNIDEELQNTVLSAPAVLWQGVENLEALVSHKDHGNCISLFEMEEVRELITAMASDEGYDVTEALGFTVGSVSVKFKDEVLLADPENPDKMTEIEAARALVAQFEKNGGKLDVTVLREAYEAAESKTQYLMENRNAIYDAFIELGDIMDAMGNYSAAGTKPASVRLASILESSANLSSDMEIKLAALNSMTAALIHLYEATEEMNEASKWEIVDADILCDGMEAADYTKLDLLLLDFEGKTEVSITNPLVAAQTVVQYNMSMYDVNVSVVLMTADGKTGSTALKEYGIKTIKLTLPANATKADIEKAVEKSGIVSQAIEAWNGVYVDGEYTAAYTALPETLTADTDYTVTYSPKSYELNTDFAGVLTVPYGYMLVLPSAEDAGSAYDYTVNGKYYAQSTPYIVLGDTVITRTEGKAYVSQKLYEIVASDYFASNTYVSAILTSGALTEGNESVDVRYPDNASGIAKLEDNKVTAEAYATGPASGNLLWTPYACYVVNGDESAVYSFENNEVTISESDYDRIEVVYRLMLPETEEAASSLTKLPASLISEADGQISTLNKLGSYQSDLESIDKAMLNALKGIISGDEELSEEGRESLLKAVNGITSECFNNDGMKLSAMIGRYNDPNNGGLRYYYSNSEAVLDEIEKLSRYLDGMLDTEEKQEAIKRLLVAFNYGDYVDKLNRVNDNIKEIKETLVAPNEAINLKADANAIGRLADALTEAVKAGESGEALGEVGGLYLTSNKLTINAQGKTTINITLNKPSAKPVELTPYTFAKDHKLTDGDIQKIIEDIQKAIEELGVSEYFYTTEYTPEIFEALKGQTAGELEANDFAINWQYKSFKVEVEGSEAQEITADNREIYLPEGDVTYRYDYIIGGATVSAGRYVFTLEQMKELFENGVCFVERIETNIEEEKLIDFIDRLNSAIGNDDIVFALTEKGEDDYAIVMKLNAANTGTLAGSAKSLVTELALSYSYIAFGGNKVIYDDDGTAISLQAAVDTIMESGFGSDTLLEIMNSDGSMNDMGVPGQVISAKEMTVAGGQLANTVFVFGNSDNPEENHQIPMYITMGSAPSALVQVRNLFADRLSSYFGFVCKDGKITLDLTMPQKAYEAYLSVLLLTENADFTNINQLNEDVALGFVRDVIDPIMSGDATIYSVENTLKKLGYESVDLAKYEKAFNALRSFYKSAEFTYSEDTSSYDVQMNVSFGKYLDRLNIGSVTDLIVERDTGIEINASVNLENLDKEYEALYFDIGAAGITNKFGLVEDASAKAEVLSGTSLMILLKDIEGDLSFASTAVLNLNGFNVNGSIKSTNGKLRIIDSSMNADEVGTVGGTVSGSVEIAGGKYESDVSALVPEGYEQRADGSVANEFFAIVKEEDGSLSVKLDAGVLAINKKPALATLAVDIAAELLMNGYTKNTLYFEGNKLYDITLDDFVALYAGSNRMDSAIEKVINAIDTSELSKTANLLLADLTDFSALKSAIGSDIENGTETPILSYGITTGAWGVGIKHVEEEDYLTVGLTTNGTKDTSLNVIITGTSEEKQELCDLVAILEETTVADITVDASTVFENKEIALNLGLNANVSINMARNPKYAIMMSVIVADGLDEGENAGLIEGLREYFEKGKTDTLAKEFNKLTTAQAVKAMENLERKDSFKAMLASLGLDGYDTKEVSELEKDLGPFAKLASVLLRRTNISGSSKTLESFITDSTYSYDISKNAIKRDVERSVRGYKLSVNAEIEELDATVKLFMKPDVVLDYSDIEELITEAETKIAHKDNYTAKSWAAFEAAYERAKYVCGVSQNQKARGAVQSRAIVDEQTEINIAARELRAAMNALVDISELRDEIAFAEGIDGKFFTAKSWEALQTAIAVAKEALTNSETQRDADNAAEALEEAINALVEKPDLSRIDTLLGEAQKCNEKNFTSASWAALAKAVQEAADLLADQEKREDEALVNAAADNLEEALAKLVNISELREAIEEAEKVDAELYTSKSFEEYQKAIDEAKAALENSQTQAEADNAVQTLLDAKDLLVEKPDLDPLRSLLADAGKLNEAEYSEKSWIALENAVAYAKEVLADVEYSEDAELVAKAAEDLESAIDGLINVSTLKKAIEEAEKLDAKPYTSKSWETFKAAVDAAKAALKAVETADDVQNAVKALEEARKALVVKPELSDIDRLIGEAQKHIEGDYTAKSWAALAEALKGATDLLADPSQKEDAELVELAVKKLESALAGLVNISSLKEAIKAAEEYSEADYTSSSWKKLAEALAAADAALNADDAETVAKAAEAIYKAIEELVEKPDLTALQTAIGVAEGLEEADYTSSSWKKLAEALAAAKAALSSEEQEAVDAAKAALDKAITELVKKPALEELQAAITIAEALKKDDYTQSTWQKLQEALAAAKAALSSEDQAVVDGAADVLIAAINGLVKVPDYSVLKASIAIAESLNKEDYTESTWQKLQEALAAAKAALSSEDQVAVNQAAMNLDNAMLALERKVIPIDYSKLQAAIDKAEKLNKGDYTEATWKELENALKVARVALTSNSQEVVNQAEQALTKAIEGLEEKVPMWQIILATVIVGIIIGSIIGVTIRYNEKKKHTDDVPLVDYSMDDDDDADDDDMDDLNADGDAEADEAEEAEADEAEADEADEAEAEAEEADEAEAEEAEAEEAEAEEAEAEEAEAEEAEADKESTEENE